MGCCAAAGAQPQPAHGMLSCGTFHTVLHSCSLPASSQSARRLARLAGRRMTCAEAEATLGTEAAEHSDCERHVHCGVQSCKAGFDLHTLCALTSVPRCHHDCFTSVPVATLASGDNLRSSLMCWGRYVQTAETVRARVRAGYTAVPHFSVRWHTIWRSAASARRSAAALRPSSLQSSFERCNQQKPAIRTESVCSKGCSKVCSMLQ